VKHRREVCTPALYSGGPGFKSAGYPDWRCLLFSSVSQDKLLTPWRQNPYHHRVHKSPTLVPILSKLNPLYPQPVSLRSILIPLSHLRFGLPSGHYPLGHPTKTLYNFVFSPLALMMEAVITSETSVYFNETTQYYIQESFFFFFLWFYSRCSRAILCLRKLPSSISNSLFIIQP
jgi:hypothetical protein